MKFRVKRFQELTTEELYKILRLRAEVFVVEQDCVYQDIDNKDQKALHVIGEKNGDIIAYTRIFDKGHYFDVPSIGRVLVSEKERKYGYGHDLIKESILAIEAHFGNKKVKISAQTYLEKFYKSHGFKKIGKEYLEDGIPHITMII
ncbi:GNAT family N-acetyltransferase [Aquimarina aquimarini]|uniref:GNAT family N-acetyltransferase n=1 Tax=Aquimarina aquimarini TaxID=1191734 RepID=UPI000D552095